MPLNPTLSSANLPFTPLRALPTAHTLLAPPYRSVAASRPVASPSVSFNPSPPRERKPRTKREESAYGGASRRNEGARARYRAVARKSERQKTERGKEGKGWEKRGPPTRQATKGRETQGASRAPRATHHILLSRLPTLTAGSVPDRRSRMPTTRAGREESHARHPAC